MPSRIPRQPAERGADAVALDSGLAPELLAALGGARRRAVRDGDRQIDTAHLLHSLWESDGDVRRVLDDGAQGARLLGYLAQRSIGYGLKWQSSVEDSGAVPVITETGWSPAAALAMEGAYRRARYRGAAQAGCLDLLAALAMDPGSRAVEVLARAGVRPGELATRIEDWHDRSRRDGAE